MQTGLTIRLLLLFSLNSFFVHFVWEMLQIPFYEAMVDASHGTAVWACTKATFGDVAIAVTAYLGAAFVGGSFGWLRQLSARPMAVYFAIGLGITVVFEFLATEVLGRWAYSELMPTLPVLNTGLTPILQWVIVPAIVLAGTRLMFLGVIGQKSGG